MQKHPNIKPELFNQVESMFHSLYGDFHYEKHEMAFDYLVEKTMDPTLDCYDEYAAAFEWMKSCCFMAVSNPEAAAKYFLRRGFHMAFRFIDGCHFVMWELAGSEETEKGKEAILIMGLLHNAILAIYEEVWLKPMMEETHEVHMVG